MNKFKIHFLLGVSRSGTSIVMSYLRAHPEIETGYEEPNHLYRLMMSLKYYRQYEEHLGIDLKVIEKLTYDSFRAFAEYFYSNLCEITGKKFAVLKHPWWAKYGFRLHQIFPEAKFIILLRHPYDVIASIVEFRKTSSIARKMFPSNVRDIAKLYNKHMRELQKLLKAFPEQTLAVKFEDFLKTPRKFLQSIFTFLDCPLTKEQLDLLMEFGKAGQIPMTCKVLDQSNLFTPKKRYLDFSEEEMKLIKKWVDGYLKVLHYEEK
jgi:hypothetical protein